MASRPHDERVSDIGEFSLIARIREWLGTAGPPVVLGPGDDCAILAPTPGAELLLTTDEQAEAVHFHRDWLAPEDLGFRALSSAASDVAAMGGRPLGAVVALGLPPDARVAEVRSFCAGLRAAAADLGCPVAGGNLSGALGGWRVVTTVAGEAAAGAAWRRSGARPGDALWLTGFPGRAHAGWRAVAEGLRPSAAGVAEALAAFRRPVARFAAVRALSGAPIHAALDLSDALSRCALLLAEASGAAVALDTHGLLSDPAAAAVARALGEDPLEYALHGGESYELLLAAPPGALDHAAGALASSGLPLRAVGEVRREGPSVLRTPTGTQPLEPRDFAHFTGGMDSEGVGE
ncbi:MAG: thiamine-phosphate kinase [Planctomycetales bacterium]|nr:thiamine-phosphate kinase [Planctomycetales bacterium]